MTKTVDPKVYDLAAEWLRSSSKTRVMSLAQCIQQVIEDWCEEDEAHQDEQRMLRGYSDDEKARI